MPNMWWFWRQFVEKNHKGVGLQTCVEVSQVEKPVTVHAGGQDVVGKQGRGSDPIAAHTHTGGGVGDTSNTSTKKWQWILFLMVKTWN